MRPHIALLLFSLPIGLSCFAQSRTSAGVLEATILNQLDAPIQGAAITLVTAPSNVLARTDTEGHFKLDPVASGRIEIQISATGYAPLVRTLTIQGNERVSGLIFRLERPGVISGRVVDVDGRPLTGITPQLLQYRHQFLGSPSLEVARADQLDVTLRSRTFSVTPSDDRGEFRVFDVVPGEYYVRLTGPDVPNGKPRLAAVFYPGVLGVSKAVPVVVTPGHEVRLTDIALPSATMGWITAHINNLTGEKILGVPAGNQFVSIQYPDGDTVALPEISDTVLGGPAVRPDGPGAYRVCAEFDVAGPSPSPQIPLLHVSRTNCKTVDYVGLDMTVSFDITKGDAIFSGHVVAEQSNGSPAKPFEGLSILAQSNNADSVAFRVLSKADGSFATSGGNLHSGSARLVAYLGLPPDYFVVSALQEGRDVLSGEMILSSKPNNIEILVSPSGARIRGKVVDRAAQAIPFATVALVPFGPLRNRSDRAHVYRSGVADQHGEFEFQGVIPGEYRAYATTTPDGWAYWDDEFMKGFDTGATVRVNKAARMVLNLVFVN